MKTMWPAYFTSPSLYLKVMQVLENYRFRPTIRRHIIDLFDRSILEIIAKERYPSGERKADAANDNDNKTPRTPGAESITTINTDIDVDEPDKEPESKFTQPEAEVEPEHLSESETETETGTETETETEPQTVNNSRHGSFNRNSSEQSSFRERIQRWGTPTAN
jgi:hypothetical protein